MTLRKIILTVIMVLSANARATSITSMADFKRHITLHRERVVALGMALRDRFYPHLSGEKLKIYLKSHDASKLELDPSIYNMYGLESPPIDLLYEYYGISPFSEDWQRLQTLKVKIDAIDSQISQAFFELFGEDKTRDFREIEVIADLVDRGLDPVAAEEFGRPMVRASSFLQAKRLAPKVEWLEERYHDVIRGLEFNSSSALGCQLQLRGAI